MSYKIEKVLLLFERNENFLLFVVMTLDICDVCAEEWLYGAINKQFNYQDSPLYVIKKEKGEVVESEDEEPSNKEPVS